MTNANPDEVQVAKNKLIKKLYEYGSVELMANLVMKETYDQSFSLHDSANPMGEDPFMAYSLGLFLSTNNLDAGEPHPNRINEFVSLLTQYFDRFKLSLMHIDQTNHIDHLEDSTAFHSQLQKILDDANPHIHPNQKDGYYQQVFFPLNDYFVSKFGFSVKDAQEFIDIFCKELDTHMNIRYKLAYEKYHKFKEDLVKPEVAPLLKQYKENNITPEQVIGFYADTLRLEKSHEILTINVDDYCKQHNILNKDVFRKYLNTFSCTFGEQFENFTDLLSDNIIFYKPIIKINDNKFFLSKPDFLYNKLDRLLEYLLEQEKKSHSETWNKFVKLKSDYLENKSFEFFSRVFPEKCLFRNLYYWIGHERREIDLLVLYDNKIFIIESKSGNLPLSAKREGRVQLEMRLTDLIKKALLQATRSRDYIKSQSNVKFWDQTKNKILLEIDSSKTKYEFFFIDVTLEHLGSLATNLKNIESFNFFKDDEYPWSVYLHDLDVVTDLLHEPIYFIHYIEQRMIAQEQNILNPSAELILLGYYLKFGTFNTYLITDAHNVANIIHTPDHMDTIEEYYMGGKEKPQLTIPKKMEILLLNMQKYRQKGFTKITSLLLDFPLREKNRMGKKIDRIFKQITNNKIPKGFIMNIGNPFNIGFSYLVSPTMTNFYKYAVKRHKQLKQQYGITRWATIGRNILDKKNHATFFIYDDGQS